MSGTLTYLLAALAAAIVCAVLLIGSRKGDITRRAVVACAISAAWGLVMAAQAYVGARTSWVALMAEALRYGAWLVVLRSLAPASPTWFKRTFLGVAVALFGYSVVGWVGDYSGLFTLPLDGVLETVCLLLAFAGLVATEQAMRNAPLEHSSHVRLCAIGVGGQLAFDLVLF
jgi:hypothetical protein